MTDYKIIKEVKKSICSIKGHDYPDPTDYGYGTIAACSGCGLHATLENDQRDGDVWVQSYPPEYN